MKINLGWRDDLVFKIITLTAFLEDASSNPSTMSGSSQLHVTPALGDQIRLLLTLTDTETHTCE